MQVQVLVVEGLLKRSPPVECSSFIQLKLGRSTHTTKVVTAGERPQWNEAFTFPVRDADQELELVWFEKKKVMGKSMVGKTSVLVRQLTRDTPEDTWVAVTPEKDAEVHLVMTAIGFGSVSIPVSPAGSVSSIATGGQNSSTVEGMPMASEDEISALHEQLSHVNAERRRATQKQAQVMEIMQKRYEAEIASLQAELAAANARCEKLLAEHSQASEGPSNASITDEPSSAKRQLEMEKEIEVLKTALVEMKTRAEEAENKMQSYATLAENNAGATTRSHRAGRQAEHRSADETDASDESSSSEASGSSGSSSQQHNRRSQRRQKLEDMGAILSQAEAEATAISHAWDYVEKQLSTKSIPRIEVESPTASCTARSDSTSSSAWRAREEAWHAVKLEMQSEISHLETMTVQLRCSLQEAEEQQQLWRLEKEKLMAQLVRPEALEVAISAHPEVTDRSVLVQPEVVEASTSPDDLDLFCGATGEMGTDRHSNESDENVSADSAPKDSSLCEGNVLVEECARLREELVSVRAEWDALFERAMTAEGDRIQLQQDCETLQSLVDTLHAERCLLRVKGTPTSASISKIAVQNAACSPMQSTAPEQETVCSPASLPSRKGSGSTVVGVQSPVPNNAEPQQLGIVLSSPIRGIYGEEDLLSELVGDFADDADVKVLSMEIDGLIAQWRQWKDMWRAEAQNLLHQSCDRQSVVNRRRGLFLRWVLHHEEYARMLLSLREHLARVTLEKALLCIPSMDHSSEDSSDSSSAQYHKSEEDSASSSWQSEQLTTVTLVAPVAVHSSPTSPTTVSTRNVMLETTFCLSLEAAQRRELQAEEGAYRAALERDLLLQTVLVPLEVLPHASTVAGDFDAPLTVFDVSAALDAFHSKAKLQKARLQEVEGILMLAERVDRIHDTATELDHERAALADTVSTALQQLIDSVSPAHHGNDISISFQDDSAASSDDVHSPVTMADEVAHRYRRCQDEARSLLRELDLDTRWYPGGLLSGPPRDAGVDWVQPREPSPLLQLPSTSDGTPSPDQNLPTIHPSSLFPIQDVHPEGVGASRVCSPASDIKAVDDFTGPELYGEADLQLLQTALTSLERLLSYVRHRRLSPRAAAILSANRIGARLSPKPNCAPTVQSLSPDNCSQGSSSPAPVSYPHAPVPSPAPPLPSLSTALSSSLSSVETPPKTKTVRLSPVPATTYPHHPRRNRPKQLPSKQRDVPPTHSVGMLATVPPAAPVGTTVDMPTAPLPPNSDRHPFASAMEDTPAHFLPPSLATSSPEPFQSTPKVSQPSTLSLGATQEDSQPHKISLQPNAGQPQGNGTGKTTAKRTVSKSSGTCVAGQAAPSSPDYALLSPLIALDAATFSSSLRGRPLTRPPAPAMDFRTPYRGIASQVVRPGWLVQRPDSHHRPTSRSRSADPTIAIKKKQAPGALPK